MDQYTQGILDKSVRLQSTLGFLIDQPRFYKLHKSCQGEFIIDLLRLKNRDM